MKDLVIIGSGGHAGVVIDAVTKAGEYRIRGLLDDSLPEGTQKHGCEIIGKLADFGKFTYCELFIAAGDAALRRRVINVIGPSLPQFATIIHPHASVAGKVHPGAYIGAGASVGPDSVVWEFAILNTSAVLEHDCILAAFSHMAPNSVCGGRVDIGMHTFIGLGACIRDGVTIGDHCIIGMGAVVTKNVPSGAKAYGNPCKCVPIK